MSDETIGTSTVFLQGANVLPDESMIEKYYTHCKELYYTSQKPVSKKDKKGKSKLEELKDQAITDMVVVNEKIGIISSRKKTVDHG